MTTSAEILRQERMQLLLRLAVGLVVAVLVNAAAIQILSMAVEPRPEAQLARRVHRITMERTRPPAPQQEQRRERQQENINKVLSSMAPPSRQTAAHQFSMPARLVQTLDPGQWLPQIDVGGIEIATANLQVDQHARLKFMPNLDRYYPRMAKRNRISGASLLELLINKEGRVADYKIISSEPAGVFEDSIPALIPHIRYEPAQRDEQPVAERRRLKLKWSLQ